MELDPQVSPEEIMSREMELDPQVSPEEIKSREVELDPQVSPEEIKSREVELDPQPRRDHEQRGGAGLRKLDFFRFGLFLKQQCNGHCPCDSVQARQLTQQLRSSALVAAQWRGD